MGAELLKFNRVWMAAPLAGITKQVKSALQAMPAGPALQPLPTDLAVEALRRLDTWLGLSRTARRDWLQRLPAVGAASLVLTAYAWGAGLKPVDPRIALGLALAAAVLGCYTDSQEA